MAEKKADMFDVNWQKVWPDRMPVILRDLAPTNPFNPRNLWPEEKDEDAAAAAAEEAAAASAAATPAGGKKPGKEAADKKGGAKLKKADLIRMQLAKDKREKQSKVDEEKLANVKKSNNLLKMKMVTPTGRLKQLYEILRDFCKKKEYIDAVDTLWEIQRTQFFKERPAKGPDGRKRSDKQRKLDEEEDAKLQGELNAIHKKYRKYVKAVNDFVSGRDLIEFQLTEMSDRLPPLNMHHMNKFILDDWQRTVLSHIDQNHSVVVCAPTSSGKTVLSSYVSVVGGKVLFIVPTDPLAWQVAALFQAMVKGSVALITEGTVFLPPAYRIAVGTPRAVESTLLEIGYDFQYAVYDEVHDLNGAEGAALERIVKAVTCPFLALSATIGNAEKLRDWWKLHHPRDVHLLEYKGRFINLQRLIWREETKEGESGKKELVALHPCAGVTLEYLTNDGFDAGDLAFTPRDTFALWNAMEEFYPADLIADVDPHTFFALDDEDEVKISPAKKEKEKKKDKKDKKDKKKGKKGDDDDDADYEVDLGKRTHRITLMESKMYELKIKKRLEDLATKEPKATQNILDFFAPPASLRDVTIELPDEKDPNPKSAVDVHTLVNQLCAKSLTPAIAFQLDSVRCRQLFNQLLAAVEAAELAKYPNFREKVQQEYEEWERNQAAKKREGKVKAKGKEEDERESQAFEERPPPDIYAPHPDFVLTPVGSRLTATEFKEIKWQLRRELSEDSDDGHALVRSLRRGIGIYNQNLPAAYLRIVQALAQAGRLAVVFSDDSLAYGVNMPFRTCLFLEDTSDDVLTSLMVQQMAGRAGRRGLDRQGNLLFAGLSWSRIQFLMRGLLPDVTGRKSLYPTISLQRLLSPHIDSDIMQRIVSHPLSEYMAGADDAAATQQSTGYLSKSVEWMAHFGLVTPEYKLAVDPSVAKLVWECRDDPSEALGIFWLLPALLKEFHHKPGDNIALQLALFNMILRVVGRELYHEEYAHASRLAPLPGQEEAWEKVTALLHSYEDKLTELGDKVPEELRLRVSLSDPLDGYVFRTVVDNLIPSGLGTSQLHLIKKRLRLVGDRLRLMHNLLMYSGRYGELEEIVRKCFRRIKWILIDSEV